MVLFKKKKILPTRHDSTVSMDYAMTLYYIMTKKAINLGEIIKDAMLTWMETPKGAMPFPSTAEKLCLRFIPSLARYPPP